MAQFLLNTGVLDTDVLGPIVFATAVTNLDDLDAIAYGTVGNPTSAIASLGGLVASATSLTGGSTSGLNFIQPNKYIHPRTTEQDCQNLRNILKQVRPTASLWYHSD